MVARPWPSELGGHCVLAVSAEGGDKDDSDAGGEVVHDERSPLGLGEREREDRPHGIAAGRRSGVKSAVAVDEAVAE